MAGKTHEKNGFGSSRHQALGRSATLHRHWPNRRGQSKSAIAYRNGALRVKSAILFVGIPTGHRPVEKQVFHKIR
jgi:hypothetical protein